MTLAALSLFASAAWAVPARPVYQNVKQADGSTVSIRAVGDENYHYYVDRQGQPVALRDGMWLRSTLPARQPRTPQPYGPMLFAPANPDLGLDEGFGLMPGGAYPSTGSPKALVLLVEFSDLSMVTPDAFNYFNDLLNKPGFSQEGASGSARDYFSDVSGGKFTPDFDLYGPVNSPRVTLTMVPTMPMAMTCAPSRCS